ncbi:hypothetical protein [Moraxella bovis]|nr:hypothetical protein [Moraxella bovis]
MVWVAGVAVCCDVTNGYTTSNGVGGRYGGGLWQFSKLLAVF